MKITSKDFSKLNPHVAHRILTIISELINYGWDFRVLYPEFYHKDIKKESPIFKNPSKELLFEYFTRMVNLRPLNIDEFTILSNSLVDANNVKMSDLIECYSSYTLELQLKWYKAIIDLLVEIAITDCSFMADSYNKAVVEYCKDNLTILNFLYLAKYGI